MSTCTGGWLKPTLDPKGFDSLKHKVPITPAKYLSFAEKDLRLGGPRGLVNGLSNAKRAIDCQVFSLLSTLGLSTNGGFPTRLERLSALGLTAPRILRNVVRLRNVLEHEYYLPKEQEVQDAIDVASLFLGATRPYFSGGSYMGSCWLADDATVNPRAPIVRTKTHTTWRHDLEPEFTYACGIYLESALDRHIIDLLLVHQNKKRGEVPIEAKHPLYVPLQSFLLRCHHEGFAYTRTGARKLLRVLTS
jgi:hypothetical protein